MESTWSMTSTAIGGLTRNDRDAAEIGSARSSSLAAGSSAGRASGWRHFDVDAAQRRTHGVGIEKIRRGEKPVAAAADALERQSGGFGLLEKLRDAGAREPHRRGEVFAGVEGAVRKLAQQRESKRSEHKPTSRGISVNFSTSGVLCAPARVSCSVQMRAVSSRSLR